MLRNWSYPEFREILYREARGCENQECPSVYGRVYAYLRALELRKRGLGYGEIRRVVKDEIGYMLSESVLLSWLRGEYTPLGRIIVFDTRRPEVGLIMGLVLSDGYKRQRRYFDHVGYGRADFYNKDEGVIEEFRESCRRLGLAAHGYPPRPGKRCWRVEVKSTLLHLLLMRFSVFIIRAPTEVQQAFLRGLWLGDGYIRRRIVLVNTDPRIVGTVSELLSIHGIEHSICGPYKPKGLGKKPKYYVNIWGCSKSRFLELTGLAEGPPRPARYSANVTNTSDRFELDCRFREPPLYASTWPR